MRETPDTNFLARQLQALPFFDSLDEAAVADLARGAYRRVYEAGEVVFLEGEETQGLYYLQSGWLKISKLSPEGREQVLQFLEPGTPFNAVGVLARRPNPASAIALEAATVWILRRETVMAFLGAHPALAQQVIARMAERILELVDLVSDLSLRTVKERLARLLLEGAEGGVLQRPQWYTQAEIAARLGTVPDVIQRALSSLVAAGLIAVERDRIEIIDREGLVRLAN